MLFHKYTHLDSSITQITVFLDVDAHLAAPTLHALVDEGTHALRREQELGLAIGSSSM